MPEGTLHHAWFRSSGSDCRGDDCAIRLAGRTFIFNHQAAMIAFSKQLFLCLAGVNQAGNCTLSDSKCIHLRRALNQMIRIVGGDSHPVGSGEAYEGWSHSRASAAYVPTGASRMPERHCG